MSDLTIEQLEKLNPLQRLIIEHCQNTGDDLRGVAKRGGISRQTISALVHRNEPLTMPHTKTIEGLAKGLGLSPRVITEAASDSVYGSSMVPTFDHRLAVLMDTARSLEPQSVDVLLATARALKALSA